MDAKELERNAKGTQEHQITRSLDLRIIVLQCLIKCNGKMRKTCRKERDRNAKGTSKERERNMKASLKEYVPSI